MKTWHFGLIVIAAAAAILALNYAKGPEEQLQDLDCGLTSHFQTFLKDHGNIRI